MKSSVGSWTKGIKGRLLFVAIFPFIAFAIIFSFTYTGLNKIGSLVESAHKDIIPNISTLDNMRMAQNRFGYRLWEGLSSPAEREEDYKEAEQALALFEKAHKDYLTTTFDPDEARLFTEVKEDFTKYLEISHKALSLLRSASLEDQEEGKRILDDDIHHVTAKIDKYIETVTEFYDKRSDAENAQFAKDQAQILNLMIAVTLCAGLVILVMQMLSGAKISAAVGGIAEKLQMANTRVVDSVEQMSEAGNALSQNSTQAAASLEETVAALEEMSSMVQMNSDNAKQAATLAISSREAAERGETEIKNLISSMSEISDSSKKIEEIISVIDDIAFQTNLLALNAAVEAARAGEQGKGFAVVAEAVRALAQRSASSAKDISTLIKSSASQVEKGSAIADQSGEMLSVIVNSIKKVSDLNNEIAAASSEQTTGIQQISKAMNQLDQTSQSNAASAEEIAATSGEINKLAHESQVLTVDLNREVLGTGVVSVAAPHAEKSEPTPVIKSEKKPTAKVIPMAPKASKAVSKTTAEETIPFDDEPRAKVGTTDGF